MHQWHPQHVVRRLHSDHEQEQDYGFGEYASGGGITAALEAQVHEPRARAHRNQRESEDGQNGAIRAGQPLQRAGGKEGSQHDRQRDPETEHRLCDLLGTRAVAGELAHPDEIESGVGEPAEIVKHRQRDADDAVHLHTERPGQIHAARERQDAGDDLARAKFQEAAPNDAIRRCDSRSPSHSMRPTE